MALHPQIVLQVCIPRNYCLRLLNCLSHQVFTRLQFDFGLEPHGNLERIFGVSFLVNQ